MRKVKVKEELSIIDIVDMLSSLAEIDITLAMEKQESGKDHTVSSKWMSDAHTMENENLVKMLFKGVQNYLEQIIEKDPDQLKDPSMRKGIQALMTFVLEAAEKIEKYSPLFKSPPFESLSEVPEYRDLHEYFASAIAAKIPTSSEIEDDWEELWGIRGSDLAQVNRRGLRSVTEIKSDKQYELFYLLKEDGRPFYDYEVLRHMKLLYDFDKSANSYETENLFYKIGLVQDKECHHRALYVLKSCGYLIDEFFKEALKHKDSLCVSHMSMSVMGLMLAANPRNLRQTSVSEKTAYGYFLDFHYYLRKALVSDEYQKLIMTTHDRRPFQSCLFLLVHKLCACYFSSVIEHREMSAIIRRMIAEGAIEMGEKESGASRFVTMMNEDTALRVSLEKFPAGAIHKMAELFEKGKNSKGFDPLSQDNIPEQLFTFTLQEKDVACLRMPAPVCQEYIQKAELAKEFEGFLRSLSINSKKQRLLFVNLQDRTSWQDFARCTALESILKKEEFAQSFSLLGLAKSSDFYMQTDVYFDQNDADQFVKVLTEQVLGGAQCGFFFSEDIAKQTAANLPKIISFVDDVFFTNSATLTREQRLDFIEITYMFITLGALDASEADYVCFSCKDGVDVGSTTSAEWFALCKMLSSSSFTEDDKGLFLYLLYSQALTLRERAVDRVALERTLSALDCMQKGLIENKALFAKLVKLHSYLKIGM